MEPGRTYDDLITRYLLNETSEEEERFVVDWMNADEKNRLHVEGLKNTLQLIDLKQEINKIDLHAEWDQLRHQLGGNQQRIVSFNEHEPYGGAAINEEKQSRKAKIHKILISTAAAAAVIFVMGLGWGLFNNRTEYNKEDQQVQARQNRAETDTLRAVVEHEVNTSGKVKRLRLPDGSEVALFHNSELTYREPVHSSRREVYLKGKAHFNVAKDKARPFTVFSGAIATTAMGTAFTVTAIAAEQHILVRLQEGKVVVQSVKGYNNNWAGDFYLVPGQELSYDKRRKTASVRSWSAKKKGVDSKVVNNQLRDHPSIPSYKKGSWFMFNNQPLGEIFDALGDMYDVQIIYSKKEMRNRYFIGTFDRSEPLEAILKQIAILNDLRVTKEENAYRIRKN